MKNNRRVTPQDSLERMEILSTLPHRAPLRSTLADVFHVYSFGGVMRVTLALILRHSAFVSAVLINKVSPAFSKAAGSMGQSLRSGVLGLKALSIT